MNWKRLRWNYRPIWRDWTITGQVVWWELQVALARSLAQLGGAITFYTVIPLPARWQLDFEGIARLAPGLGLLIGGGLALLNLGGIYVGIPPLTRSVLLVVGWIAITGGLHLDGVMDSADGLAVPDTERRLAVMSDSVTGAFGVMAGLVVLLLKVAALHDLGEAAGFGLMAAAGWGRWGQLVAIARFPYLKPQGKGAFHHQARPSFRATLPSLVGLIGFSGLWAGLVPALWPVAIGAIFGGFAIAIGTGAWFNHRLGGHTGDTYGAVVEWTEAGLLVALTLI